MDIIEKFYLTEKGFNNFRISFTELSGFINQYATVEVTGLYIKEEE
jgi:hypothetical protein